MKKEFIVSFIFYLCFNTLLCSYLATGQQIVAESPFKISFRQSPAVSDESGKPRSPKTRYFPAERFVDSTLEHLLIQKKTRFSKPRKPIAYNEFTTISTRIDTFKLKWFSYYLYKLQEPVLSNYSLNKEIYRLTWIRSFHPPVVVRIEKQNESVHIFTKMLSQLPELPGHYYRDSLGNNRLADTTMPIPFDINSVKALSKSDFDQYVHLLANQKALLISPLGITERGGADGSEWILETHRPDGYYFIVQWSPSAHEPIRMLGNYLLNHSSARYEERY